MTLKDRIIVTDTDEENISSEELKASYESESEFIKRCEILLINITKNYREQRDEIRNLMKLHKQELKYNIKNKRTKKNKDNIGFTKATTVPDKLADFVGLEKGVKMSRPELTKLLCNEFKKRNLYYKKDERVIIPDNDVKQLFSLPKDADKSTDPKDKNGLNFYNLQHYVAKCYKE